MTASDGPDDPDAARSDGGRLRPGAGGDGAGRAWSNGTDAARPPERSPHLVTVLIVGVTFVVGSLLATRVGPALSVALAVGTGAAFAASLWLVDRDRRRVPAYVVAGTLSLVVGAGVVAAVGYATLTLLAAMFPVSDLSLLRPQGLQLLSAVLVVVGTTVAVVGALGSVGSVLRRDTARAYASLSVKTFVVPFTLGVVLVLPAITSNAGYTPLDPILDPLVALVDGALGALFQPRPRRTHAFTFLVLTVCTALAVERALGRLPVEALPSGRRERASDAVARVRRWLRLGSLVLTPLLVVSVAEVAVAQFALRQALGPLYDLLVAVTAAHWIRTLAFLVIVCSVGVVSLVELLESVAGTTPADLAVASTPFVGGAAVVVLVLLAHGAVVDPAVAFVADSLPGLFAVEFSTQATLILRFFGSAAVGLILAAGLVGLTAAGSLALAVAATAESLPDRATGPALAASGLFVAAAFAAGAGVDAPLVLAGLVAAFLVWDAGEYGATLGREVGAAHARGPVVTHLGGTVAVGAVLVVGVGAVLRLADMVPVVTGAALPAAFAVLVVGLAVTAAALR